jgi:alpha-L-rhamnosidase
MQLRKGKNMLADARWIWCPASAEKDVYVDFFAEFSLSEPVNSVRLEICAVHQYAVFLRNECAAFGQYTDLPQKKSVQTHELARWTAAGQNWLHIRVYYQGEDTLCWQTDQAGLIFALYTEHGCILKSDSHVLCRQAAAYETGENRMITPQLGFSFHYCQEKEWKTVPPDGCKPAVERERRCELCVPPIPKLQLLPQQPMRVQSQGVFWKNDNVQGFQYAALAYRESEVLLNTMPCPALPSKNGLQFSCREADGVYLLLDAGTECCGLLCLDLELPQQTLVTISFGEHLDDLRVRDELDGRHFSVTYTVSAGRHCFTHWFKRFAGRYMQLSVRAGAGTVYYAGLRPVQYPVSNTAQLHCGDRLEALVYTISKHTLQLCLHEHYEDCPWREQALYGTDSRLEMLCGYYAFGEYTAARASLELLAGSQRTDGLLELCSPGKNGVTIPGFSLNWVCALEEYLLYSGDTSFARQLLPRVEKLLDGVMERRRENGLLPAYAQTEYWNFYEWSEKLDGGEIFRTQALPLRYDAPLNALACMALQSAERLYSWCGKPEKAAGYAAAAQELMQACEKFWDSKAQCYATYLYTGGRKEHTSRLTQALLLCCQTENLPHREAVRGELLKERLQKETLSSSYYRYRALLDDSPDCAPAVFDEIASRWGGMLMQGAATFWETERGADDFHRAGSLCHGWSAIPIYFYFAYGLGIRPKEPGYAAYEFRPLLPAERFPDGRVLTPGGLIDVKEGRICQPPEGGTKTTHFNIITNMEERQ